ncbi:MAG: hypothetical protein M1550_04875 [Deltaproteobacteria bacterium]|nr:hypothetical protein [Deltaproteobacteria bacterium]
MKALRSSVLIVLLAVPFAGCGTGIQAAMFRPGYPPTTRVDVYRNGPPDRPYVEIAQLEAYDRWNALGRLVERAKSIGADGIIILRSRYEGTDVSTADSGEWVTPLYDLVVVAIRYK